MVGGATQVAVFVGNMQGGDEDVTVAVPLEDGEYSNLVVGGGPTQCRPLRVLAGQVRANLPGRRQSDAFSHSE